MSNLADESGGQSSEATTETATGLLTSIKAVREIIMMNNIAESETINELNTLKQSRYEERVKMEEEIEYQKAKIIELQSKVEQSQEALEREKALKEALEQSHASLEEHKKELILQLDTAAVARASLEEKISEFREGLEKEEVSFTKERSQWEELVKAIRQQKDNALAKTGELEAKLLTSQQETKELKDELLTLKQQIESTRTKQKETIQGYINSNDRLKERIQLLESGDTQSLKRPITTTETPNSPNKRPKES